MFTQRCLNSDSRCVCVLSTKLSSSERRWMKVYFSGSVPELESGLGVAGLVCGSHRVTDSYKALSGCPAMCFFLPSTEQDTEAGRWRQAQRIDSLFFLATKWVVCGPFVCMCGGGEGEEACLFSPVSIVQPILCLDHCCFHSQV